MPPRKRARTPTLDEAREALETHGLAPEWTETLLRIVNRADVPGIDPGLAWGDEREGLASLLRIMSESHPEDAREFADVFHPGDPAAFRERALIECAREPPMRAFAVRKILNEIKRVRNESCADEALRKGACIRVRELEHAPGVEGSAVFDLGARVVSKIVSLDDGVLAVFVRQNGSTGIVQVGTRDPEPLERFKLLGTGDDVHTWMARVSAHHPAGDPFLWGEGAIGDEGYRGDLDDLRARLRGRTNPRERMTPRLEQALRMRGFPLA